MATVPTWLSCDAVSGQILGELPDLSVSGSIGDLLGDSTSASLTLPIPPPGAHGAPPAGWERLTRPRYMRRMLVAVLDGRPMWAGIVLRRRGGTAAEARLATVSVAGYLDRRFVGDHDLEEVDEATIAATLVADAQDEGIGLTVDVETTGTLRDRTYRRSDDATVLSRLQDLAGVQGGPEWHVLLDWSNASETAVDKIVRIRSRIGAAAAGPPTAVFTAGSPAAVASAQGAAEASYELDESYVDGDGANHIIATSSGEGESRPESSPARDEAAIAAGAPRVEHRWSPSSSISDVDILDGHAASALELMATGARSISVKMRADRYPRLGEHWQVGDDVGYDLIGHRHPNGLVGAARVIGWEMDPHAGTISPVLLLPDQEA